MNSKYLIGIATATLLLAGAAAWHAMPRPSNSLLDRRLAQCGSLPNGSTQTVAETTRMFINIPKDLYPNVQLEMTSSGASAGYISNGGRYGSALGAQGKPDCWSYYFEFDGTGTLAIASQSGVSGVPDYLIHVVVAAPTSTRPQACTQEAKRCLDGSYVGRTGPDCAFAACPAPAAEQGDGTLQGTMTIGPICPVEQVGHPCNPTPQMYAAHPVYVYDADGTKLVATLTPDAEGNFSATLLAGAYLLDVQHQSVGAVRGVPATVDIETGKIATIAIDIDTGIR